MLNNYDVYHTLHDVDIDVGVDVDIDVDVDVDDVVSAGVDGIDVTGVGGDVGRDATTVAVSTTSL